MRFPRILVPLLALLGSLFPSPSRAAEARPNVLFIVADDLNHWVGSLQRNPQTKTPNLDRLAQRGVNFTNAYCASSICNPSRAALLSGKRTATIGVYSNGHLPWTDYIDESQCLNAHFRANGYFTAGAGKIFHVGGGFKNSQGTQWDEYVVGFGKDQDVEDDEPQAGKGKQKRFTNGAAALKQEPRKGNIKIGEFEIGAPAIPDRETEDYKIAEWGARHVAQKRNQPFFLALGFHKPHLPWIVPKKYFDLFPLDTIELPPHRADDLADLPPSAKRWAHTARWTSVMDAGGEKAWKQVVQAYLASIAYLDAQVGVVLDALEKSPNRDNTIVIFFGDHGWHFGEKGQHHRHLLRRSRLALRREGTIRENRTVGGRYARAADVECAGRDEARATLRNAGGVPEHLSDALRSGGAAEAGVSRGREHPALAGEPPGRMDPPRADHLRVQQSRRAFAAVSVHPFRERRGRALRRKSGSL
jgi:arylsulfatase A-like enzyme